MLVEDGRTGFLHEVPGRFPWRPPWPRFQPPWRPPVHRGLPSRSTGMGGHARCSVYRNTTATSLHALFGVAGAGGPGPAVRNAAVHARYAGRARTAAGYAGSGGRTPAPTPIAPSPVSQGPALSRTRT